MNSPVSAWRFAKVCKKRTSQWVQHNGPQKCLFFSSHLDIYSPKTPNSAQNEALLTGSHIKDPKASEPWWFWKGYWELQSTGHHRSWKLPSVRGDQINKQRDEGFRSKSYYREKAVRACGVRFFSNIYNSISINLKTSCKALGMDK